MLAQRMQESVQAQLLELCQAGAYRQYVGRYSAGLTEQLAAQHLGADVLLASSGTAALEIALRAAGVDAGDEVILSAYDYPGNFWAIDRVGARPVLIDLDQGWNISTEQLDRALDNALPNRLKALVASHLHGQMQPAAELREWCDRHQLVFIEDNCQALGASHGDRPSGTLGHVGIISFGGGKVLSAGRGGALLTEDAAIAQKARLASGAGSGPYALSEIQAAVVLAQLPWLPQLTQACRDFFGRVQQSLERRSSPHLFPAGVDLSRTAFYQGGWLLPPGMGSAHRDALVSGLRGRGIAAGTGFSGFHRRSTRRCRTVGELPHTAAVVARTWIIHHSTAVAGVLAAEEVAEAIMAATSEL